MFLLEQLQMIYLQLISKQEKDKFRLSPEVAQSSVVRYIKVSMQKNIQNLGLYCEDAKIQMLLDNFRKYFDSDKKNIYQDIKTLVEQITKDIEKIGNNPENYLIDKYKKNAMGRNGQLLKNLYSGGYDLLNISTSSKLVELAFLIYQEQDVVDISQFNVKNISDQIYNAYQRGSFNTVINNFNSFIDTSNKFKLYE